MNWTYHEYQPSGILAKYIDCIWTENYSDHFDGARQSHYVLPDNTIELIFSESEVKRRTSKGVVQKLKSHLCGLKTTHQQVHVLKSPLLGIRIKPIGLYRLTNIDKKALIDGAVTPDFCFGMAIQELEEKLFLTHAMSHRIELIEAFFLQLLAKSHVETDMVFEKSVEMITASQGILSIGDIARQLDVSIKTIERRFIANLGITPKKYCRLVRIFYSLKASANYTPGQLTSVAHHFEFYDQAHFIKEVKAYTGLTPSDFLKLDKRVQTPTFS